MGTTLHCIIETKDVGTKHWDGVSDWDFGKNYDFSCRVSENALGDVWPGDGLFHNPETSFMRYKVDEADLAHGRQTVDINGLKKSLHSNVALNERPEVHAFYQAALALVHRYNGGSVRFLFYRR